MIMCIYAFAKYAFNISLWQPRLEAYGTSAGAGLVVYRDPIENN